MNHRSVLLTLACEASATLHAVAICRIEVVERGSGWPVPLIELRTTHQVRLVTDNAGRIALDLPELMDRETWFDVIGHGYEVAKDGFGYRGVRLTPEPGKITFPIMQRLCGPGIAVPDEDCLRAMAAAFQRLKIVAEPGGAVALAAALWHGETLRGGTVIAVVSGGNVDSDMFCGALARYA